VPTLLLRCTLDIINRRWGRGTLKSAAEGMEKPWQMKRQRLSPGYITDWAGLPVVSGGAAQTCLATTGQLPLFDALGKPFLEQPLYFRSCPRGNSH